MIDPNQHKRLLRQKMVRTILALDPRRRSWEEAALAERFEHLPGFAEASVVLLYASHFPEEFSTTTMLKRALELNKTLICPRVDRASKRLRLHRVERLETDLVPGVLGIGEPSLECPEVEPEFIDWVLMPGLAFDRFGYRLGRGAGHYDRLLPALHPDVPRWALAFEVQRVDSLPVEPHDQPIDGLATATGPVVRPSKPRSVG